MAPRSAGVLVGLDFDITVTEVAFEQLFCCFAVLLFGYMEYIGTW